MSKNVIISKGRALIQNLSVAMQTMFSKRDKNVVLIGAWMGEKFADNSRFLYQYLFSHKQELGLNKVVWVTRKPMINDLLNSLGYDSFLIGSPESKYWHLKAGVHILCNMAFPQAKTDTDLDTKYSWGAVKFQLWHGVGMKSVGAASNDAHKARRISKIWHNSRFATWCTLGGWNDEFFLSTSHKNAEINQAISLCKEDHLFISAYPRNCECLRLLPSEQEILNRISSYKKVIGYFPTFRSDNSKYIHPLSDCNFIKYLKDNDILWVEKKHSNDKSVQKHFLDSNTLFLESNFDLNVLFNAFDLVISDYSSVVFDCAYKGIPVIMYCPDLYEFKKGDVGFLFDIESYCDGIIAKSINECCSMVQECFNGTYFRNKQILVYKKICDDFFDNRDSDYQEIWNDMKKIIEEYTI